MTNTDILTYEDVKKIQSKNSKEELVGVRYYDNSIIEQYEKFDMVAYTGLEIQVRRTAARMLADVNEKLKNEYNLRLKIVYGYRAPEVQAKYFNKRRAEIAKDYPDMPIETLDSFTHNFVAVPDVAGHITGGAVDITMTDMDGNPCNMGTNIADYSDEDRIKTYSELATSSQRRLRLILLNEMKAVGFAPFLGEWWHFSYGDKEWAAYYGKPAALYGPYDVQKTASVFRIAGGNETVLQVISGSTSQSSDEVIGRALLDAYPLAEQSGLFYSDQKQLVMSGGEFCGNAAAAAAILLLGQTAEPAVISYRVSGFNGTVTARVVTQPDCSYKVRTTFNGVQYAIEYGRYDGVQVGIVDMKGITHVLIEEEFPRVNFEDVQCKIIDALGLRNRDAVGVIWYKHLEKSVSINPVVWVKKIDTLYYESACGSGSIAAALCTGESKIFQPTGEAIAVNIEGDKVVTVCSVEIIARSNQ